MESVKKMALKYYPRLWSKERIDALHAAGKLTDAEYTEVIPDETRTGQEYEAVQ